MESSRTPPQVDAGPPDTIDALTVPIPPVDCETVVDEVAMLFSREAGLNAVTVVDGDIPVGIITRVSLSTRLFAKFGHAIFGRKACRVVAKPPLVTSGDGEAHEVLARAMARPPDDLYDDVVVVDPLQRYSGMLSVRSLVLRQGTALATSMAEREIARQRAAELEEFSRLKSTFLSHVTHELRAPVNTMIGLAELLSVADGFDADERFSRNLAMLRSSAVHLRALVNNVLDLARIEAGRMEIHPELVDPIEIAREVAASAEVLVRDREVAVHFDAAVGVPRITTDPVRLRQVITNLVNNAAKFTDRGSITVGLSPANEGGVRIEVHDTGCGIAPEDRERIFTAFAQVGEVKTRRHEGTGLGLTIVANLLELLVGTLSLESVPGNGSTFTVTFPSTIKGALP